VSVRLIWAFPRSTRGNVAAFTVEEHDALLRVHDEFEPRSHVDLRFVNMQAYSFTADSLCTLDHIEAIDKVLELESSGWGAEVASHRIAVGQPALHHYRVYLEGRGAYDVLAEAFLQDGAAPRFS
jgi:hypothetical protein